VIAISNDQVIPIEMNTVSCNYKI